MSDKEVKVKELDTNIKRLRELSESIKKEILFIAEDRVKIENDIKVQEVTKKDN